VNVLETIRMRILEVLRSSKEPLTAQEIAAKLGLEPKAEKEIYKHITHLAKSVWRRTKGRERIVMIPPSCRNCGYVFKKLEKPRRPSKCPRCKSSRIEPPRFILMPG